MMNVTMSAIVMMICMLMSMAYAPVTSVNIVNMRVNEELCVVYNRSKV